MRPLNRNEKFLLLACLLTVFVVVNLVLFQRVRASRAASTEEIASLEEKIEKHQAIINGADLWNDNAAWIDENLPSYDSAGKVESAMLEMIREAAEERGFKISKAEFPPSEDHGHYQEISVSVELYGGLAELEKWVATLQKDPRQFRHIRDFELELLKRNPRDTTVTEPQGKCQVLLSRWFKPKTRT